MNNMKNILSNDEAQTRYKPNILKRLTADMVFSGFALFVAAIVMVTACAQLIEAHAEINTMSSQTNVHRLSDNSAPPGVIALTDKSEAKPIENKVVKSIGNKKIKVDNEYLVKCDLPDKYSHESNFNMYKALDKYEPTPTYHKNLKLSITPGNKVFIDKNGFARHKVDSTQFKVNGNPDYVIGPALIKGGNIQGKRYLIVTYNGMYTVITGEKKVSINDSPTGHYEPKFSGLRGSTTVEKVYNFFRDHGCSHESAIGILANMEQESGIDPSKCRDDETAKGIVQWRGGRFNNLVNFAAQRGRAWTDLESQLEFLWVELNSADMNDRMSGTVAAQNLSSLGINGHPEGFEGFKATDDAHYATALFEGSFERSGGSAMHNRYNNIYGLDQQLKDCKVNDSGLLKLIVNSEIGSAEKNELNINADLSESTRMLKSKILCIYQIN